METNLAKSKVSLRGSTDPFKATLKTGFIFEASG